MHTFPLIHATIYTYINVCMYVLKKNVYTHIEYMFMHSSSQHTKHTPFCMFICQNGYKCVSYTAQNNANE